MNTISYLFQKICLSLVLVIVLTSAINAQQNQYFQAYYPPLSNGKWHLETYTPGQKTIIPCHVVRSGSKVKSGNDSIDIATLAFSRGVTAWNTALASANIPLALEIIETDVADANLFSPEKSSQNTFAFANNDVIPSDTMLTIRYGAMLVIRRDTIIFGKQKFLKIKNAHIILNRNYFREIGILTTGVSIPQRGVFNLCFIAAHELGHFLGIRTHEVGNTSIMLPGGDAINSSFTNCDCDNVKVVLGAADIKLLKMLYPEFQLQATHQNDSCLPRSNEP